MNSVNASLGSTYSHVCNCIGCCKECGQCRTAPWHAKTCNDIEKLNEKKRQIVEKAMIVQHFGEEEYEKISKQNVCVCSSNECRGGNCGNT